MITMKEFQMILKNFNIPHEAPTDLITILPEHELDPDVAALIDKGSVQDLKGVYSHHMDISNVQIQN